MAKEGSDARLLIRAVGTAGDPQYLPWLIKRMSDDKLARLAGESLSLIAGADLAWLDLELKLPENAETISSENPDDDDVAMDEDASLPWPDAARAQTWWAANQSRFASGARYFVGEPVDAEHCRRVLGEGYQRERRGKRGPRLCRLPA